MMTPKQGCFVQNFDSSLEKSTKSMSFFFRMFSTFFFKKKPQIPGLGNNILGILGEYQSPVDLRLEDVMS